MVSKIVLNNFLNQAEACCDPEASGSLAPAPTRSAATELGVALLNCRNIFELRASGLNLE